MEQVKKPVAEEQKRVKFTRSTFETYGNRGNHNYKKIWCFRPYLGKREYYGAEYGNTYNCYNCKGELIFYYKDPHDRAEKPFRVHEVFIETKERVNECGNKEQVDYYKGYCCKC
jgi:hypothetical protein